MPNFTLRRDPEEVVLSRSIKYNGPTVRSALLEVLIVLAVGVVVIGVWRGWFTNWGNSSIKATSSGSAQPVARIATAKLDSADSGKSVTGSPIAQGTNNKEMMHAHCPTALRFDLSA